MDHFVVELDDPKRDDVRSLLEQHLDFARKVMPPEDVHALDLLAVAAERGVRRVSLETGAGEAFEPGPSTPASGSCHADRSATTRRTRTARS